MGRNKDKPCFHSFGHEHPILRQHEIGKKFVAGSAQIGVPDTPCQLIQEPETKILVGPINIAKQQHLISREATTNKTCCSPADDEITESGFAPWLIGTSR